MERRTERSPGGTVRGAGEDGLDALRRLTHASDAVVLVCLHALNRDAAAGRGPGAGGHASRGATTCRAGGDITFASTSHALDDAALSALDHWSARLARDPGLRIVIGDFACREAYSPAALGLALQRVDVIRKHLRSRGLAPGRIDVAVCGQGWFMVERTGRGAEGDASGRALLQIVDPISAASRN